MCFAFGRDGQNSSVYRSGRRDDDALCPRHFQNVAREIRIRGVPWPMKWPTVAEPALGSVKETAFKFSSPDRACGIHPPPRKKWRIKNRTGRRDRADPMRGPGHPLCGTVGMESPAGAHQDQALQARTAGECQTTAGSYCPYEDRVFDPCGDHVFDEIVRVKLLRGHFGSNKRM